MCYNHITRIIKGDFKKTYEKYVLFCGTRIPERKKEMYVKYAASIEKISDSESTWVGSDVTVFKNVAGADYYNKEVYFYPSTPQESVWLWVLGHERAVPNKAAIDRCWRNNWVLHICVSGRGYYNGKPISRGCCFISWPHIRHSIVADPDDPFEFYWLILRGDMLINFVRKFGFSSTDRLFSTDAVDTIVGLFELGMTADYNCVDVYEYTMALVRMIFSYYKRPAIDENADDIALLSGYVHMAKQLLRDSNYSLYVSDVALKLGITPKHLSKVFNRETGESIKQYIMRKRFDAVENFLELGLAPSEVARAVGYSTYTAFYRAFVAKYSMTPSEYMKKMSNT